MAHSFGETYKSTPAPNDVLEGARPTAPPPSAFSCKKRLFALQSSVAEESAREKEVSVVFLIFFLPANVGKERRKYTSAKTQRAKDTSGGSLHFPSL